MLRVLNEAEMKMVSGGTDNCVPIPDGISCEEHSNPSVTPDFLSSIGMTVDEWLNGGNPNISPDLIEHVGDLVLPEGVSVGSITLPDPDPTIDPQDPTASQTVDLTGLTFELSNGARITAGANSSGTVGVNVTQDF